jgi:hypothetical protein
LFGRLLWSIRDCIRTCRYLVSVHAAEEMTDDGLSITDVEHGILEGRIVERQRDSRTGEWKYVIRGSALDGESIYLVVKRHGVGKVLVITVFRR